MTTTPWERPRRLRRSARLRDLVRETALSVNDLVCPIFVTAEPEKVEVSSMPGVSRWPLRLLPQEVEEVAGLGLPAVLLFGLPAQKDERGSGAYDPEGIVQQAARLIKQTVPGLIVITDVCLCEYTSHGHCGIVDEEGRVLNDPTLELLAKTALSQAEAGADVVAPSDMMDGRVAAIREALDEAGLSEVAILSYAAKYASAFYGPFREAAGSAPAFGDRRSYQMDPANRREARREVLLDVEEGADIILVKPALSYLDIVREVRDLIDLPLAAYNVSGEYALVKAAAEKGWIDERNCVLEILTAIRRAGADMIVTYHAKAAAAWLRAAG
jgi:porphobilinogen synthase